VDREMRSRSTSNVRRCANTKITSGCTSARLQRQPLNFRGGLPADSYGPGALLRPGDALVTRLSEDAHFVPHRSGFV
jgi:hypothetical protein